MTFKLEINMDNAAFEEDPGPELTWILRRLAEKTETWTFAVDRFHPGIYDSLGNKVGTAEVVED
jgi:hypothetical protein